MADTTRIDPEDARNENKRLHQLGSHFAEAVSRMQSAADHYKGCWGGDEFGKAFEKGYLPSATEALKTVGTFGTNVKETADQVDQMITSFENADKNNAANLNKH